MRRRAARRSGSPLVDPASRQVRDGLCRRARRRRPRRGRPVRCAPSASGSSSTCTTVASAPIRRPCRIVHMFSAQPQPDDQVGVPDQLGGQRRGEAAGDVERPGVPVEQPLGDRRASPATPRTARPRRLQRLRAAPRHPARRRTPGAGTASSASSAGPATSGPVTRGVDGSRRDAVGRPRPSAASFGLHVQRQVEQDGAALGRGPPRPPRGRRPRPVPPDVDPHRHGADRARRAPPGRRRSSTAAAVTSAATTTIGVRLLAASVIPVIALVRPHPWCTVTAADRPLIRA